MKTMFDSSTRSEVITRIDSLSPDKTAMWGKMNVYQMTRHCVIWDEWVLGTHHPKYKQDFLGLIFGKLALKSSVKDDSPMKKNMPAGSAFVVKEPNGDLQSQKDIWRGRIEEYEHYHNPDFIHDFFGKMTREQIGIFAYKHADHHLRQFGC